MFSGPIGIEPVQAAVWYALNHYQYDDAVFLAERLNAEVGTLSSVHLLATCYYRSGHIQQAKHLLSLHRPHAASSSSSSSSAQCDLLYARCCLQLKEYQSGLLALNGLLCLHRPSEDELACRYGNDVGVAFWLLGELNRRLHQFKESAGYFRSALKYNPFLWSSFQALCDMGESPSPEECFKVLSLPGYLQHGAGGGQRGEGLATEPSSPPPTQSSDSDAQHKTTGPSAPRKELVRPGLVTPVPRFTPGVGLAVASSTPTARALPFTKPHPPPHATIGDPPPPPPPPSALVTPLYGQLSGVEPVVNKAQPGYSRGKLSVIKCDFGSSSSTAGREGGEGGAQGVEPTQASFTPLAPSFGVLDLSPSSSSCTSSSSSHFSRVQKALDFTTVTPSLGPLHTVTPSPASQPTDCTAVLKCTANEAGAVASLFGTPAESRTDMPHPLMQNSARALQLEPTSLRPHPSGAELANQMAQKRSHDVRTPPRYADTPPSPHFKTPGASVGGAPVRRSARLSSGVGKSANAHSFRRHGALFNMHGVRGKARHKPGGGAMAGDPRRILDASSKRSSKVTFNTPAGGIGRKVGVAKQSHSNTPIPTKSAMETDPTAQDENLPLTHDEKIVGVVLGDSVKSEGGDGVRMVTGSCDQQEVIEKAAMSNINSLMALLQQIGSSYVCLASYDLAGAVRRFSTLPAHQRATPWVLSLTARAYFTGERFKQCVKLYEKVHRMDPHRQEGMEFYSSALWHLQQEVPLSLLASQLYDSSKLRPQALCAMASVMNLNKDHDASAKYLQRAIQICPDFTYAHTLLAHEYWMAKDYERALASFQSAIATNPRHHNAWYGMAHVCYAQEKYQFAEIYAKRALDINKSSSIACTQLALAQFQQEERAKALQSLSRALAINSSNPIPRFHKAKILESMGRLEEALKELEVLTVSWPKEPALYVSKGKILKKLNRTDEAMIQLSWAMDFMKTSSNNQIKEEIDQAYHLHDNSASSNHGDSDFTPHSDAEEDESDGSVQMQLA